MWWCAARILDFVKSGKLALGAIKFFVLDEADRLLEAGDAPTVYDLFSRLPRGGSGTARLQVLAPCCPPPPPGVMKSCICCWLTGASPGGPLFLAAGLSLLAVELSGIWPNPCSAPVYFSACGLEPHA